MKIDISHAEQCSLHEKETNYDNFEFHFNLAIWNLLYRCLRTNLIHQAHPRSAITEWQTLPASISYEQKNFLLDKTNSAVTFFLFHFRNIIRLMSQVFIVFLKCIISIWKCHPNRKQNKWERREIKLEFSKNDVIVCKIHEFQITVHN